MAQYILCLETSAKTCTVAISNKGECLLQLQAEGDWKHSQMITLLIKDLLAQCRIHIEDLKAVALSKGPGSYTGLRVGASAAKAICYVQNIPLIALDSLKVAAQAHIGDLKPPYQFIIPLIDARRMEVYYNIYDQQLNEQSETSNLILTPQSFESIQEACIICGDGASKVENYLIKQNVIVVSDHIEAKNMTALAYSAFKAQDFENIAYFNPFYLKKPNITKSKKSLF